MKHSKKIGTLIAALLLGLHLNGPAAAAAFDDDSLLTLEDLVSDGDLEGLVAFLIDNPELLEGDSDLAEQLRAFLLAYQAGGLMAFTAEDLAALARAIDDYVKDEKKYASIY